MLCSSSRNGESVNRVCIAHCACPTALQRYVSSHHQFWLVVDTRLSALVCTPVLRAAYSTLCRRLAPRDSPPDTLVRSRRQQTVGFRLSPFFSTLIAFRQMHSCFPFSEPIRVVLEYTWDTWALSVLVLLLQQCTRAFLRVFFFVALFLTSHIDYS